MSILNQLAGGERRDKGASPEIAKQIIQDPSDLPEILKAMMLGDVILAQRCAHVIRYVAQSESTLLLPHKAFLLNEMAALEQWEVREQFCMAIVCLELDVEEQTGVLQIFKDYLENDRHSIVRTCALQGMADLVKHDPGLKEPITTIIAYHSEAGTAAMRARCRKLLKVLAKF